VAFTSPKTWSFGEILTSTDMNTYVRDNTQELFDRDRILNVVSATKTDTQTGSGTTWVSITGLSVTITPATTSSKILLIGSIGMAGAATAGSVGARFTGGNSAVIADAFGSRLQVFAGQRQDDGGGGGSFVTPMTPTLVFLDSPNTTSPITYSIQIRGSSNWAINRQVGQSDNNTYPVGVSTITAMEVAG
jgi:hypothetical protein